MRLTTCLGLAAFALTAPSAMASADNCNAPPGTSGIDQYCEVLPSPGGTNSHHSGGGGHKGHKLPPSTTQKLKQGGSAGAAVIQLTDSSGIAPTPSTPAPTKAKVHHKASKHSHSQSNSTSTSQPAGSAAPATAAPASDKGFSAGQSFWGALGGGFVLVLALIAALFGALAWYGRRRPEEQAGS